MQAKQARIETVLDNTLSQQSAGEGSLQLLDAMRYATLNGGKRLRALLVYAVGDAFQVDEVQLDFPACAVEMIHAYSLVHDDMPAMDDDDLRRGKPSCHKAYDEATALLTGDALQSMAFATLSDTPVSAEQRIQMVNNLAMSSGHAGMAGGQAIDLESVGQQLDLNQLETMHRLKTAALIQSSVQLPAILSGDADTAILGQLADYGLAIGLAFQIQDDILDVTSDTQTLGKIQGADDALNKPTYPALLGLTTAQDKAHDLIQQAFSILEALPHDTTLLAELTDFIVNRRH